MRKLYVFGALFLLAGMAAIILMSSGGLQLGHVDRSVRTVTARCPQYNSSAHCIDTSPGCSQIGSNISGYCHLDMVVKVCAKTCGCCDLCGFDWVYNVEDNVCYQIVLEHRTTWQAAREYCMRHEGDLLSISSVTERNFIFNVLRTGQYAFLDNRYWIGATDQFMEGRWQWTDNTPFQYTYWYHGEPNNGIGIHQSENCAQMEHGLAYRWNDVLCTNGNDFICEKKHEISVTTTMFQITSQLSTPSTPSYSLLSTLDMDSTTSHTSNSSFVTTTVPITSGAETTTIQTCREWGFWNCQVSTLNGSCVMTRIKELSENNMRDCLPVREHITNDIRPCAGDICPAHWTAWAEWHCTQLNTFCFMARFRDCSTGNISHCGQESERSELKHFYCESCPGSDWEDWSYWHCKLGLYSTCTMSRYRQCRSASNDCEGNSSEILPCTNEACPHHYGLNINCGLFDQSHSACTDASICTDLVKYPDQFCPEQNNICPISCGCCEPSSNVVTNYTTTTTHTTEPSSSKLLITQPPTTLELQPITSTKLPIASTVTSIEWGKWGNWWCKTEDYGKCRMFRTRNCTEESVLKCSYLPESREFAECKQEICGDLFNLTRCSLYNGGDSLCQEEAAVCLQLTFTSKACDNVNITKFCPKTCGCCENEKEGYIVWEIWSHWTCKKMESEISTKCLMYRERQCPTGDVGECPGPKFETTDCDESQCKGETSMHVDCSLVDRSSTCKDRYGCSIFSKKPWDVCNDASYVCLCPQLCACCVSENTDNITTKGTDVSGSTTLSSVTPHGNENNSHVSTGIQTTSGPSTGQGTGVSDSSTASSVSPAGNVDTSNQSPAGIQTTSSQSTGPGAGISDSSTASSVTLTGNVYTSTLSPVILQTTANPSPVQGAGVSDSSTASSVSPAGNVDTSNQSPAGIQTTSSPSTGPGAGVSDSSTASSVTPAGNNDTSTQTTAVLATTANSSNGQGAGVFESTTSFSVATDRIVDTNNQTNSTELHGHETDGNITTNSTSETDLANNQTAPPGIMTSTSKIPYTITPKTSTKPTILEMCNFDAGTLCTWIQSKNDDFDWDFQSGKTLTERTGPNNDHTLQTAQGKYLFIESSSPRLAGELASIVSPELPSDHTVCLEFWYYMFGDSIGSLQVHVQDGIQLFKKDGEQGEQWLKACVTIYSKQIPNNYRLVITANVGSSYLGDTAIDDLALHDGACEATSSSTGQGTDISGSTINPSVTPDGNGYPSLQTSTALPAATSSSAGQGTDVSGSTINPIITPYGNGNSSLQTSIALPTATSSSTGQGTDVSGSTISPLITPDKNGHSSLQTSTGLPSTTVSLTGQGLPGTAGQWSEWFSGKCTVTCGYGTQHRLRFCSTGQNKDCLGSPSESIPCYDQNCQAQGIWSEWFYATCSTTCGDGTIRRFRQCSTGLESECPGKAIETIPCKLADCQAASWSEWFYGECSKTCGDGRREQHRRCSTGNIIDCLGSAMETVACHVRDCPGLP